MSTRWRSVVGASVAGMLAIIAAACEQSPNPLAPAASVSGIFTQPVTGGAPDVNQQLAALRKVTARFHDLDQAISAGWNNQLTGCLTLEGAGGQGFHYSNPPLIDGSVSLLEPELLLYEPRGNGTLHLLGVEYIVPISAWTGAAPPSLYGETFHRNEALGLWVLHVWIWKPNPSGMFADWNPQVSCPV